MSSQPVGPQAPREAPRPEREAHFPRRAWHTSPSAPARLASSSLRTGWWLLLLAGLGMLLAVEVVCTVLLYSALVSNVQVQAALRGIGPEGRDIEIVAGVPKQNVTLADQEDAQVRRLGAQDLGAFTQSTVTTYLAAQPMLVAQVGRRQLNIGALGNPLATLEAFNYAETGPHMRLLAGALPQPDPGGPPEALVTAQMAQNEGVHVGDAVVAQIGNQNGVYQAQIAMRVVGIWEPLRPDEDFWNGRSFYYVPRSDTDPYIYPVLLDRATFLQAFSTTESNAPSYVPSFLFPTITQYWVFYTDPTRITSANMASVGNHLGLLRAHLAGEVAPLSGAISVLTRLQSTLQDAQQQLALLGLPLFIVVAQIVGLALLFVAAMGGALVEGQADEIAMLRTRGASGAQLLGSYAALGGALAALAALAALRLASPLAVGLVYRLIPASTLATAQVGRAYLVRGAAPEAVIGPAVAAALLALAAVLLAAQRALGLDVLAFRREEGRATRQPFWQRYYLDFGLAVICAVGYLELGQFGGLGTRTTLGAGANSPLLLVAPALLLLAGSLLLLRVLPRVAGIGMQLAARGRGAVRVLTFAQVVRSPTGPSRLALLLALAVGLGLFALTFDASLGRNAADQASYQAGADLRLVEQGAVGPATDASIRQTLAALPGVVSFTPVYRDQANTSEVQGATNANLLGVDPSNWGRIAGGTSWRADYASAPLATLMALLQHHQWGADTADQEGQTSAGDTQHPVWALVSQSLAARLQVGAGDRFALVLPNSPGPATHFAVAAVINAFPTLYPAQTPEGFLVLDLSDLLGAIHTASQGLTSQIGPNEYWLKTTGQPARDAALVQTLDGQAQQLELDHVVDRSAMLAALANSPVKAGIQGLLLAGAAIAAALAALGTLVQSAGAARRRVLQFAVLRTLGMTSRQLVGLLLGEQALVYVFGLSGGTLLGVILAVTTLPYLQFSATTIDPSTLGTPPYVVSADPVAVALFYVALFAAGAAALLVVAARARSAMATIGLGNALRLDQD